MSNNSTTNNTMNNSNNDVSLMTERANTIFLATQSFIMEMPLNQRLSLKKLAEEIGMRINMEPAEVFPYTSDFARHNTISYVSAGKFGGVVRGQRKLKGAKSITNNTSSSELLNDDTTEE